MKPITMSATGRLTLPSSVRQKLGLTGEARFEVEVTDNGVLLRPVMAIPQDDVWIYTPENLARIEAGLADVRAGRVVRMSLEELQRYGDEAEAARRRGEEDVREAG